jgi:hypothetical protein
LILGLIATFASVVSPAFAGAVEGRGPTLLGSGKGMPSRLVAAQGVVSAKSFQLNVMGLVGGATPSTRFDAENYLVFMMTVDKPIAVSVNEICPSQVHHILDRMGGAYDYVYATSYVEPSGSTRPGTSGCVDSGRPRYGNVMFMRYDLNTRITHFYSESDASSTRNVVCMKTSFILLTYFGCSTHLSQSPPLSQRNEFYFLMGYSAGNALGSFSNGDLNTWRSWLLTYYLGGFKEADLSNCSTSPNYCKRPTADSGSAIDYIFGSPNTSISPTALISPNLSFSDHKMVTGYVNIPY